ncbi:MAG: DUF3488 and DUF4129 domain-containing transglutaminase family protein, partial [Halobacteriaceae archaeon]
PRRPLGLAAGGGRVSADRPPTPERRVREGVGALLLADEDPVVRGGALVSVAVLAAAYLAVLYHVVDVVGGVVTFVLVVAAAVGLAGVIEGALTDRQALVLAVGLLVAGLAGYLLSVPPSFWVDFSLGVLLADIAALLTGFSVLQMVRAGVWALAVTPAPTFLVAYFALRGEYVRAVIVGGGTLGFFVLTGDSGTAGTLLGTLGATSALGFSVIARYGGSRAQIEGIAVAIAVMILASAAVTAVPADETQPVLTGSTSVESDLRSVSDTAAIGGSVWLSPKVRFTVEADQPRYWRIKAYDRFTGTGWTRTGEPGPLSGARTPGPRETVTQTVTAKTTLDVVPAAADPVEVSGIDARLTPQGTLVSGATLRENESYTVVSRVPNASADELRNASTDYAASVRERYLQLPESTPERVGELAANVTEEADNPYDAAKAIEEYLESNKEYSTTVPPPDENVAAEFLFERDQGYCVYYATTMVTMLRSQGIPARYVVGYTPGQRVAEDKWVVRGLDSHAWVEVYFPGYGWITFDPTPGAERGEAETSRLEEARENGVQGVDAAGSEDGTWTPTTTAPDNGSALITPEPFVNSDDENVFPGNVTTTAPDTPPGNLQSGEDLFGANATRTATTSAGGGGNGTAAGGVLPVGPVEVPSLETLALWSVLLVGLAAGSRRTGVAERAYRAAWVRWQPATGDRHREIEGAYARVEYLLGRDHRPRREGETVRAYLASLDVEERVRELAALRERARYAEEVSPESARRARELADGIVADRLGVATTFNRLLS